MNIENTSIYPVNNIHDISKTPSIIGKMEDEYVIRSSYGLKAKTYIVRLDVLIKGGKGISEYVVKSNLFFADYNQIVNKGGVFIKKYIVSSLHTIYTELKSKIALYSFDDKRYLVNMEPQTLACRTNTNL